MLKASFGSYVLMSFVSSLLVVIHAFSLKRYFYNAVVYLTKSKIATVVLGNCGVVCLLLVGKFMQAVFLGPLRFREEERLQVRIREAVIESCLAMTVFREEFNSKFIGLFAVLLFLKIFHWLSRDRVEYMEEQPNAPLLAHARLISLMAVLFALDIRLVVSCATYTMQYGPSFLVLFAFEFAVLSISLISTITRYGLNSADSYLEGRWDAKGMISFYNELLCDASQLIVYIAFFLYVQAFYTLPLHIIRDIYLTFTKFHKRCVDFLRYRRVASSMNELFPDATEQDFSDGDRTCIICREEMQSAKKLNCGHIFHVRCLQSWLRRQLSCPVCRANVEVSTRGSNTRNEAVSVLRNYLVHATHFISEAFTSIRRMLQGELRFRHAHLYRPAYQPRPTTATLAYPLPFETWNRLSRQPPMIPPSGLHSAGTGLPFPNPPMSFPTAMGASFQMPRAPGASITGTPPANLPGFVPPMNRFPSVRNTQIPPAETRASPQVGPDSSIPSDTSTAQRRQASTSKFNGRAKLERLMRVSEQLDSLRKEVDELIMLEVEESAD